MPARAAVGPHKGFTIVSIERNQDTTRWIQYQAQKRSMEARSDHIYANEQQLFHGTSAANVNLMCANGFDRSFSSVAAFGDGVYFARGSRYSANTRYATPELPDGPGNPGVQTMILARVLVGMAAQGARGLIHPPLRHQELRFDSLADAPGPGHHPTASHCLLPQRQPELRRVCHQVQTACWLEQLRWLCPGTTGGGSFQSVAFSNCSGSFTYLAMGRPRL